MITTKAHPLGGHAVRSAILAVVLVCLLAGHATAAAVCHPERPHGLALPADAIVADSADTTVADTTVKSPNTPYHKIVKQGGSVQQGLLTVRHIKDKWYWEVPDSLLGRLMLAVTRFLAVPQDFKMLSGEEANRSTVYFEAYNDEVLFLREYVLSQYAARGHDIAAALPRSTTDPVVARLDVVGRNPQTGARLVDVTKLLLSDSKLVGLTATNRRSVELDGMQSDRSFIDTVKVFPINIEVQTLRTYSMGPRKAPTSRTGVATLTLTTSMVLLPKEPMTGRLFDERVGYFNNRITQFSDNEAPAHEAFISRYRLEPKDPKAYRAGRLTEPKKPIVYYIDPATPRKWVPYLKAGIDDWNKAFEAAGFKNAIVARDWPDDPSMSLDDARFSVLRYLPSETLNAYGPRIVDPRSGEIIEAHICWYHNVMTLVKKWYMTQCGPLDRRAQRMDMPDELVGQLIRFVSSHEVGHTLGLRHNMIASSATPVERLRDRQWLAQHGHTASIMDYARFNYVAQPEDNIPPSSLFPRIGDYDCWAIRWGYQWRPELGDAFAAKDRLRSEVTAALEANPRLRWVGDEGKGQDPRSQTEDLGDNQMRATEYGLLNLRRVVAHLVEWTAQKDGQYDDLEEMHRSVRSQYVRYLMHVQRYLGGKYTNNWPANRRTEAVPADLQRQAVEWIGRNLFTAPLWLFPDDITSRIGGDYLDEIRSRQTSVLSAMLSPAIVFNLDMATLQSPDAYAPQDYLDDLFATVWTPLDNPDERQNNLRRQLQRNYVALLDSALNATGTGRSGAQLTFRRSDAIVYVEQHLQKVETYLAQQPQDGTFCARHYAQLLLEVRKIRQKYEQVRTAG